MGRERPANTSVRHGMASCAIYDCKRPECLEAQRRGNRESYHGVKQGIRARVSTERAMEYIKMLARAGMPVSEMARISGVSETRIGTLRRGTQEQIYRITEEAILGIPMPREGYVPKSGGLVGATGARRRLQALAVQGFPLEILAGETESGMTTLWSLRSGSRTQVHVSKLREITEAHDRLWDSDPSDLGISDETANRVRRQAKKQGWYPTEAWKDIDDPDCKPVLKTPKYIRLTEDAQELYAQGYDSEAVAERLGVSRLTLRSAKSHYTKVAMAQ